MSDEIWLDIPGFEGSYQASNHGRIRSLKVLKLPLSSGTGYPVVTLTGQRKRHVHVLVARTFIGPRPSGLEVNHKNSNRQDVRPENLEYVTRSENNHHAFRMGNRKLYFTEAQMDAIADMFFVEGISNTDIAKSFLPSGHTIQQLRQMRRRVRSVMEIWRASKRPKGTRNPYEHKLSEDQAEHMRKLYEAGAKQSELAKLFGCHPAHVSRVVRGEIWGK